MIDQTQLAHIVIAALVCLSGLTALAVVLRHQTSMRASVSEVAELKKLWHEGNTTIAEAQSKLDVKIGGVKDDLQNLRNRIGK